MVSSPVCVVATPTVPSTATDTEYCKGERLYLSHEGGQRASGLCCQFCCLIVKEQGSVLPVKEMTFEHEVTEWPYFLFAIFLHCNFILQCM